MTIRGERVTGFRVKHGMDNTENPPLRSPGTQREYLRSYELPQA